MSHLPSSPPSAKRPAASQPSAAADPYTPGTRVVNFHERDVGHAARAYRSLMPQAEYDKSVRRPLSMALRDPAAQHEYSRRERARLEAEVRGWWEGLTLAEQKKWWASLTPAEQTAIKQWEEEEHRREARAAEAHCFDRMMSNLQLEHDEQSLAKRSGRQYSPVLLRGPARERWRLRAAGGGA